MIQIKVLSGKVAGTQIVARHFPFCVGRGADCDLVLNDDGIWNKHLEISVTADSRLEATFDPEVCGVINGNRIKTAALKTGDVLGLGSTNIQIWLAPAKQRRQVAREVLTWILIGGVAIGELALVYVLIR